MPVCKLDTKGYCERHQRKHPDHELEIALADTRAGEAYRMYWDRQTTGYGMRRPSTTTDRARSLAVATAEWVKAGRPVRTEEEQVRIHQICEACPHYVAVQDTCSKCGCGLGSSLANRWMRWVGIPDAIKMATHHCPEKKW